jgi:hypothetical protein
MPSDQSFSETGEPVKWTIRYEDGPKWDMLPQEALVLAERYESMAHLVRQHGKDTAYLEDVTRSLRDYAHREKERQLGE